MADRTFPTSPDSAEKAFLVAVETGADLGWTAEESLQELAALTETAGAEVVGSTWQRRSGIHPLWYVGKGKAAELAQIKGGTGFTLLITDDELSSKQQKSLESVLGVKVLDRSGLILDIFAQHAHTHEGRLQVELAQLEYQLPRLTRLWTHLSRTGGGIGTRGPGETQLETDRRVIRERIKKLKERVEAVRRQRETAARGRDRSRLPTVAIVGYTNAGKSTLLNGLVGESVVSTQDQLFATLDPTSRKVDLGDGQVVIVSDTVGFIHKLPHHLVDAFRATLEEVNRADAILRVVDAADAHAVEHLATVRDVLDEIGAGARPSLVVANKLDLLQEAGENYPAGIPRDAVRVSARKGWGLDELRGRIASLLAHMWVDVDVALPYSAGSLVSRARERGRVDVEYRDGDVVVRGKVVPSLAGEIEKTAGEWRRRERAAPENGRDPHGRS